MSIFYGTRIELAAKATKENIQSLLEYGATLHCKYLDDNDNVLTVSEAVEHIFLPNEDDIHGVTWMQYDTSASLLFLLVRPETLNLSLISFSLSWRKDFMTSYRTINDHARYLRFLISLSKNFIIKNLNIGSDLNMLEDVTTPNTISAHLEMSAHEDFHPALFAQNAYFNSFTIFKNNQETCTDLKDYVKFVEQKYKSNERFTIKVDNYLIGVEVEPHRAYFYPISLLKTITTSSETLVDVTFYVEALLNFCENFGIHELKVNI